MLFIYCFIYRIFPVIVYMCLIVYLCMHFSYIYLFFVHVRLRCGLPWYVGRYFIFIIHLFFYHVVLYGIVCVCIVFFTLLLFSFCILYSVCFVLYASLCCFFNYDVIFLFVMFSIRTIICCFAFNSLYFHYASLLYYYYFVGVSLFLW